MTAAFAVIALVLRETATFEIASQIPLLISALGIAVLKSVVALLVASLWDRRARHAIPGLFVMGLVVCVAVLDGLNAGVAIAELELLPRYLWAGRRIDRRGLRRVDGVGLECASTAFRLRTENRDSGRRSLQSPEPVGGCRG